MEERKGGAAVHQLCINSNTCVRRDMHAYGMRERCRHNNRSEKENVTHLYHHLCLRYGVLGGFG